MRKLLGLIFCLSAGIYCLASDQAFQFSVQPGPHTVGFRVVLQYDTSRIYRDTVDLTGKPVRGERARPIQTLIWYPAQKSSAAHVTYGDYLALLASEENFSPTSEETKAIVQDAEKDHDANLSATMLAIKDAKPESGTYPLVIYAPSFSAPSFENADLCEYLASHGYVVIASPDMGAHTRNMTPDVEGIEAQARDISFLIGYARSIPQADLTHIAVAGFSWGGISNLFAAAKDDRIGALIDLDGSARYFPKLIAEAKYVHPEEMTIPLLFFTQSEITLESLSKEKFDTSGSVLNQITHGDVYITRMHAMRHGDFSSFNQHSANYWKHNPPAEYSQQEVNASYSWVAQYTLKFLEATFKQDASAAAFLKNPPVKNGVPAHLLAAEVHSAKGMPLTQEAFAAELARRGFSHAGEVYAELKAQNPEAQLSEGKLNGWAWGLVTANHLPEAVEIFKLNVSLHPDSSAAYENLGEAYEKSEQRDLAIDNYKKSTEKNPQNEYAERKLKEIQEKKGKEAN